VKKNLNLTKNLGFLMFTLIFVGLIVFLMIIPTIKEYRSQSGDYRRSVAILEQMDGEYNTLLNQFSELKRENKKILQSFQGEFNVGRFLRDSRAFFTNTSITKLDAKDYMGAFQMYEFNTTSNIKNPQVFYDFLEYLSKYDSVIEGAFPIYFENDSSRIDANFKLKVYSIKE
jgi:hypothetical protein